MGFFGIKSELFQNVFDLLGVALSQFGSGLLSEGAPPIPPHQFGALMGPIMGVSTVVSTP
jgi:hypothetical protein